MSAIPELEWAPYHMGDIHQWQADAEQGVYKVMQLECQNEHGNEWRLIFPEGQSLYFQTESEAKSRAERDNLRKWKLMHFDFKAEVIGGHQGRKQEARGEFACLFSENPADSERQLKEALALQKTPLQLIAPSKVSECFFQSFSADQQVDILRELKDKDYWLYLVGVD